MPHSDFGTGKNTRVPKNKTGHFTVQFDCPKKDIENQRFEKTLGQLWTLLGQLRHQFGSDWTHAQCVTLGCPVPMSKRFAPDAADLNERDFTELVNAISDLGELEGFANRRSILNAPDLKRWSVMQRDIILARKWKLQNASK
jgi:hypothetical protein